METETEFEIGGQNTSAARAFFCCFSGGVDDDRSLQYRMADTQQADQATEQLSPQNEGVNSPTEIPPKRKNIFMSTLKTMKKPFLYFKRSNSMSLLPQENPDLSEPYDPGLNPDPKPVPSVSWLQNITGTDPVPESSSVQNISDYEPNSVPLNVFYTVEYVLGHGSFGTVFKGTRKSDGDKVAIKRISKRAGVTYVIPPDYPKPVFREAAMMVMLRRPPTSPYVIYMFEWFDHCEVISLVVEYPKPCLVLREFVTSCQKLPDRLACSLMHQLVQAVEHCISRRVFPNDIHMDNILVNTANLKIKLIDFGNAHLLNTEGYNSEDYIGAILFCPPEAITDATYHAVPTNVWSMGISLFFMVNGDLPFLNLQEIQNKSPITVADDLSNECRDLINKCLKKNPVERPTLEQILQHRWFNNI